MERDLDFYGCSGDDDSQNNTAALQAALNDNIGALGIPSKKYRITSQVTQTKPIRIFGNGKNSHIWLDTPTPPSGVINVSFDTAAEKFSPIYRDLAITGPCPALFLNLSASYQFCAKLLVEHMFLTNNIGGYSFTLNNPTNIDGLFCSRFHDNQCYGGFNLQRAGDSLTFDNNTITGPGHAFNLTAVNGASHVIMCENNITVQGMALLAGDFMYSLKFENNQVEHGGSTAIDYMILIGGTQQPFNPTIRGNNINGHNLINAALIAMYSMNHGLVDENILAGCPNAVYLTSNTSGVRVGKRNINSCPTFLVNQSTSNIVE